ncbi:MAG: type II toxin-antitoxin system HipA family toxin [Proteobacteria bacterium]|nr:MAG: type II toxin-antitoxin system HipA family toxin [Pseudomonadota bacterium]
MNKCLLTYTPIETGHYSPESIRKLAPALTDLSPLPMDAASLRFEALARADKMSIQGVQSKLSAKLSIKEHCFEIVDKDGRYILKPQSNLYPQLPENEDLSMHLAGLAKIEVPLHGLVYAKDNSLIYFIKRFDRKGQKEKVPTEDFAQLSGHTRETKYRSSMEQVAGILDEYCSFPLLEKQKLFERTIFNFLIGNEDMHLKNFSLITIDGITKLSPAYDLLNTSIVLRSPEEIALPLKGKKSKLTKVQLTYYFAQERLELTPKVTSNVLERFHAILPVWRDWIGRSFLGEEFRERYLDLLSVRERILFQ